MADQLIFVCRPGAQGARLAGSLGEAGFSARHTPSLEIIPLATELPKQLPEQAFHIVIFISPTAVVSSFAIAGDWLDSTATLIAVGSGTAAELTQRGYEQVITPETFNSEGLLALPELQSIKEARVLVVKGEGGRQLLQETLISRGANCTAWSVYRRSAAQIAEAHWQAYAQAEQPAVTCASIETLAAFDDQRKARNLAKPELIYVASDRIADHAQALGYTGIIQVGGAMNELFIAAIKQQAHG